MKGLKMFRVGVPLSQKLVLPIFIHLMVVCMLPLTNVDALTRPIDRNAHTIYYHNTVPNARGDFHFEFQTTNGITTKAAGNENGHSGVVQYVSLEGIPVTMTYVADADGYHPNGDHIPMVPEHVFTTLEYIRTHQAVDEKSSRKF